MEFAAVKNHQFRNYKDCKECKSVLSNFTEEVSGQVLEYHKSLPHYKGRISPHYKGIYLIIR